MRIVLNFVSFSPLFKRRVTMMMTRKTRQKTKKTSRTTAAASRTRRDRRTRTQTETVGRRPDKLSSAELSHESRELCHCANLSVLPPPGGALHRFVHLTLILCCCLVTCVRGRTPAPPHHHHHPEKNKSVRLPPKRGGRLVTRATSLTFVPKTAFH